MSVVSRDGNRRKSLEKVVTPKGMVNGGRSSLGTSGRPTLPLRSPDGRGAHQDALASPTAKNASSAETLTVIARFREPKVNTKNVPSPYVFMDEKMVKVNFDEYESKVYQFDTVFPPSTQQPELFQAVEGTIDSVLKGFNATILACKFSVVLCLLLLCTLLTYAQNCDCVTMYILVVSSRFS